MHTVVFITVLQRCPESSESFESSAKKICASRAGNFKLLKVKK